MNIAVVGTGYVGLVTGVSLAELGHSVICIDIDEAKVEKLQQGISPIYEPGLEELMKKNLAEYRLLFTVNHAEGCHGADVIYIAVGTPESQDGSADLTFVKQVARDIAIHVSRDTVVATKSTVPVGTNHAIQEIINANLRKEVNVKVVSNPEFLKEGSAIYDAFHGDRIVIGSDSKEAAKVIEEVNAPFGVPFFHTDIRSAEMIKYAANAFLATKISFINEISAICERFGADVGEVAKGMGMDKRIGDKFLNAGIGYGGSCFPKDTKALIHMADSVHYEFDLLKDVVTVNKRQQVLLLDKLKERLPSLESKRIAVLGLAFKPNTDDMREAASLVITNDLINSGAEVIAYDPIAVNNAKRLLDQRIKYAESVADALKDSDAVLVLTEWEQVKQTNPSLFNTMNYPLVIDGRNCFELEEMQTYKIEYHSIGRPVVNKNVSEIIA